MPALTRQRVSALVVALLGVALLYLLAERVWPMGPDHFYYYRPLADEWVSGSWRLYGDDQVYMVYPPWSAVFIAPLGLLPLEAGKAVLFVFTIVCIIAALRLIYGTWRIPPWVLFVSLANLFTLDALLLVCAWFLPDRPLPEQPSAGTEATRSAMV